MLGHAGVRLEACVWFVASFPRIPYSTKLTLHTWLSQCNSVRSPSPPYHAISKKKKKKKKRYSYS